MQIYHISRFFQQNTILKNTDHTALKIQLLGFDGPDEINIKI